MGKCISSYIVLHFLNSVVSRNFDIGNRLYFEKIMSLLYSFIQQSVLRQVQSLFQSQLSTQCDLELPPSMRISSPFLKFIHQLPTSSSSSSCYFYPPFNFPSIKCCRRQFIHKVSQIQLAFRLLISCTHTQYVLKYYIILHRSCMYILQRCTVLCKFNNSNVLYLYQTQYQISLKMVQKNRNTQQRFNIGGLEL